MVNIGRRLSIFIHRFKTLSMLVCSALVIAGGVTLANAHADQYTDQILNLEDQNAQNQSAVNELQTKVTSYQDEIQKLQSQIGSFQSQINTNLAKQAMLQQKIASLQTQINQEKQVLGETLKALYVDGQMTTVEMLATSKSLSDFVNAETYDSAVQNKIQDTLNQISQLQNQVEGQKDQVDLLLQTQQTQQAQLNSDESEQNQLLSMDQTQQTAYNQKIQSNNSQIATLEQEEVAANQSGVEGTSISGGPCGGSASAEYGGITYSFPDTYPDSLCSKPQDYVTDPWGLLNRECVSYTAWMEASTGHYVPYGLGNATDWPGNVPRSWVSSTPQVGDVAIRPAIPGLTIDGESDVGHAMYVDAVLNSDTIVVSEYNEDLNGDFSVQVRSTNAPYNGYTDNLVFIHFPTQN